MEGQQKFSLRRFIGQVLTTLLFLGLIGLVGATAFVGYRLQQDTSSEDASAIVDGRLESGYPAAAYLLSQDSRGSLRECGSVIIEGNRAITAAHCVDSDSAAFVGIDRPDAQKNLVTTAVTLHPSWNGASNADSDLAIVTLADSRDIDPARIGSPRVGCNYVIVGYGEDERGINGLRKSADVCIESVSNFSMQLSGLDGTACFGDSGSPIFRQDTNEVVGVVSQILTTADNPCARTDSIRATRIDSNLNRIFAPQINFASSNVDQPISLDLLLTNQEYIGNDQYEIIIEAEILNNTRDALGDLSVDWCVNDNELAGSFAQVNISSAELGIRPGFGTDTDCHVLQDGNTLDAFSRKQMTISGIVTWPSTEPLPIDMFVSAVLGDKYRVFALSNNRDLPQILPNSSTLLVTLEKPLINPDNQQTFIIMAIAAGVMLSLLFGLNYLKTYIKTHANQQK